MRDVRVHLHAGGSGEHRAAVPFTFSGRDTVSKRPFALRSIRPAARRVSPDGRFTGHTKMARAHRLRLGRGPMMGLGATGALATLLRDQPLSPGKVSFAWSAAVGDTVARVTTVTLDPEGGWAVTAADGYSARELHHSHLLNRLLGDSVVNRWPDVAIHDPPVDLGRDVGPVERNGPKVSDGTAQPRGV